MSKIILASPLLRYTNNESHFDFSGETLGDVLAILCKKKLELSKFIYRNPSELHPFINIFRDDQNVKDLQGLNTQILPHHTIRILPGISGG